MSFTLYQLSFHFYKKTSIVNTVTIKEITLRKVPMVKKFGIGGKTSIEADVIVLGCTLPGLVAAHKLLKKFGDSMDIVLLDLHVPLPRQRSKVNVAFMEIAHDDTDTETVQVRGHQEYSARELLSNVARWYLLQYSNELRVPLPDPIIFPEGKQDNEMTTIFQDDGDQSGYSSPSKSLVEIGQLQKLFQYRNGSTVEFLNNVHDFEYLNLFEKFELNQYQAYLDKSMSDLFQSTSVDLEEERKTLLFYDQTSMEANICETLFFSTSREIMRIIVRLVCGAPAHSVSLLFYLHQCYRTSSAKNHLGGLNTRFREKLLGHCRKRLTSKLCKSVADITMKAKSIKGIRRYSQQVILETIKGETTYICNLLAMALKPDEIHEIQVEDKLISEETSRITAGLKSGKAKKFCVLYEENIWSKQGYSGDIFSMRGPIIWAMERPRMSTTGSLEKYSGLIGYLMVRDDDEDCRAEVLEQLVNLFGSEAAEPVSYRETLISDVFVPRCGDYLALRSLISKGSPSFVEWGALDLFAEGDVAAALEAGHTAYLHLMSCLRPQAQTFDDMVACEWPTFLKEAPFNGWLSRVSGYRCIKLTMFATSVCLGVHLLRTFIRNR